MTYSARPSSFQLALIAAPIVAAGAPHADALRKAKALLDMAESAVEDSEDARQKPLGPFTAQQALEYMNRQAKEYAKAMPSEPKLRAWKSTRSLRGHLKRRFNSYDEKFEEYWKAAQKEPVISVSLLNAVRRERVAAEKVKQSKAADGRRATRSGREA